MDKQNGVHLCDGILFSLKNGIKGADGCYE
jgi:hypothetical protein